MFKAGNLVMIRKAPKYDGIVYGKHDERRNMTLNAGDIGLYLGHDETETDSSWRQKLAMVLFGDVICSTVITDLVPMMEET